MIQTAINSNQAAATRQFKNKTACISCGAPSKSLKTNQVTCEIREVTYQCGNQDCLCIFKAQVSFYKVIRTSLLDDRPHAAPPAE